MRTIRTALALACGLLPFAPSAAGAAPEADIAFQVAPAAGSATGPGGGYFIVAASPGRSLTQAVAVHNDSDGPLDLRLSAVDAATAQVGGTAFGADTDKATDAGAWVVLDRTSVALGPGASTTVGFRVTVPADAASGVHLAGISAFVASTADAAGASFPGATVQSRRVIAVQVDLPGPAEPELIITGVAPVARPDGLYAEMAVANRGGGLTKAEGNITVPGDNFTRPFSIDTFLPGTSIAYPVKWTDNAVDGDHPAHVEIRYGDRVAVWHGALTMGRAPGAQQATQPFAPVPPKGGFPILPLAAAIAAATVLVAGGNIRQRRLATRSYRTGRRGSTPARTAESGQPSRLNPACRRSRRTTRTTPCATGGVRRIPSVLSVIAVGLAAVVTLANGAAAAEPPLTVAPAPTTSTVPSASTTTVTPAATTSSTVAVPTTFATVPTTTTPSSTVPTTTSTTVAATTTTSTSVPARTTTGTIPSMTAMSNVAATTTTTAGPPTTTSSTVPPTTSSTTAATPGLLSVTHPSASNFTGGSIIGGGQTATAILDAFSVSDLTGSGGGWQVTAQATRFAGVRHRLAAGSLSMSAPNVAPTGVTVLPGPTVIDGSGGPARIASAELGAGGVYDFSATTLTLVVPAGVYADVYSTTITISVVSGP